MLSVKTKYGLSVVLTLASNKAEKFSIKALSCACNVPKKYLEQILNALRKEGVVSSTRGVQGGYQLGRLPSEITVYNIAYCLEKTVVFSEGYNGHGVLEAYWKSVDLMFKTSLNVTIEQLVKQYAAAKECLTYTI